MIDSKELKEEISKHWIRKDTKLNDYISELSCDCGEKLVVDSRTQDWDNTEVFNNHIAENIISITKEAIEEIAKAYGGCTNCYGKGYATINNRWSGYATDGDIGGVEGYISGGKANAMKFCKCERGKQLKANLKERGE